MRKGSGGFQIYSDASKKGLGCVLMQHGKVSPKCSRFERTFGENGRSKMWLRLYQMYDLAAGHEFEPSRASGLFTAVEIPMWKWDMSFMISLLIYANSKLGGDFSDRNRLVLHGTPTSMCPTEIRSLRLVFGKDYRKLGELVLSSVQHFILKPMVVGMNICAWWSLPTIIVGMLASRQHLRAFVWFAIRGLTLLDQGQAQSSYSSGPFEVLGIVLEEVSLSSGASSAGIAVHDVFISDMSLSEETCIRSARQERVMRKPSYSFCEVSLKNPPEHEATWETDESMTS
ncbi:hypothetical protein Tco_0110744 [Tanacetum coccineum]